MGFQGQALLAPRPTPKLEDHPLSVVRDCLFNLFAATLHIGGRFSIRNLRTRHAVVTGTHLSHGEKWNTCSIMRRGVAKKGGVGDATTPGSKLNMSNKKSAPRT